MTDDGSPSRQDDSSPTVLTDGSGPTVLTDGSGGGRFTDFVTSRRAARFRVPLGLVVLVLLLRPVLGLPFVLDYGQIANTILIWMLFAASFNILVGYTGMLSFGHAMFLGFGAYGTSIGIVHYDLPFVVAAGIGVALATIAAYVIGRLTVQKGEIYFAMLTLAFAQSIHFIANQNYGGLTGGSTGLTGVLPAWLDTFRGVKFVALGPLELDWYYPLGLIFVVSVLAIWQLVRSPFGRSLVAIRENEQLARAVGIDTRRYKVWSFTFSGLFAALAGVLMSINDQGATLETLAVPTSGDVILMTVLGGTNFFFGPLFGAFVWLFSEEWLSGVITYWQFFLGLLFVVSVLVAPRDGLWGLLQRGLRRVTGRSGGER